MLVACQSSQLLSCSSCLCQPSACPQAWAACVNDARCLRAARCLAHGCPSAECAAIAGVTQVLLLPVAACMASVCPATCVSSGQSGAGGDPGGQAGSGPGGEGGEGGEGGVPGQGG
ncbi:MAG: hypothetical protein EOO75_03575, partial [Myxococcales bacterium]